MAMRETEAIQDVQEGYATYVAMSSARDQFIFYTCKEMLPSMVPGTKPPKVVIFGGGSRVANLALDLIFFGAEVVLVGDDLDCLNQVQGDIKAILDPEPVEAHFNVRLRHLGMKISDVVFGADVVVCSDYLHHLDYRLIHITPRKPTNNVVHFHT